MKRVAWKILGRVSLWPNVVERIMASPLFGVGLADLATYMPQRGGSISTPHNAFLFFALSAGVIPLSFWSFFWFRTGRRLFQKRSHHYARFKLPFFLYALVQFNLGDLNNDPWVLLALAVAAAPGFSQARASSAVVLKQPGERRGFIMDRIASGLRTALRITLTR